MDTGMMERFVTLKDFFQDRKSIFYVYDYGDDCRHRITLVGEEMKTAFERVRCMLATGIAPPEECRRSLRLSGAAPDSVESQR